MNFPSEAIPNRIHIHITPHAHGYCPIIITFASCTAASETRAFMSGSFFAGCSLLALLLQSSQSDSTAAAAAAAASVDELLLEDIRFAAEELRPLIRTRSGDAVRAFFPNMRATVDEAESAESAGEEGGGGRQELGGLLEVVMTQDERDRSKKSNGGGDKGK